MDKINFVTGIHSLLRYHRGIGINEYPRSEDSESFLRFQPLVVETPGAGAQVEQSVHHPAVGTTGVTPEKSPLSLGEIAEEVAVCRACDLHLQRLYPVAGRGPENVSLLLVGDWLAADAQGNLPAGQLFGVEEDRMLARMLTAIQVPLHSVFVTNVIKCAVPATCQPQANHVQSCMSFLRRQIVVLRPRIICTMGMVAARAVLEKPLPLSRLRGKPHMYDAGKNQKIPVVTTYHPTYLMQNAEMKAATWADLQLLARELQKN